MLDKGERDPDHRLTSRNGYRDRRVRDDSYFLSLLEPRRRAEQAIRTVVQEAYVPGLSTRPVEDLVEALGIASLSKSEKVAAQAREGYRATPVKSDALDTFALAELLRREPPSGGRSQAEPRPC